MQGMFPVHRIVTRILGAIAIAIILTDATSVTDTIALTVRDVEATADTSESEPVESQDTTVTLHEDADPRWIESLTDALDRFHAANLEPFAIDIHVWTRTDTASRCRGHAGFFTDPTTGPRIDICIEYHDTTLGTHLRLKLVLHELAHAWIHTHVADTTRLAFMASRGIESWNGADHTHSTRGTEIAANVMLAALHPDPPANPDQTCGYELLTGHSTPFARTDTCASSWSTDGA